MYRYMTDLKKKYISLGNRPEMPPPLDIRHCGELSPKLVNSLHASMKLRWYLMQNLCIFVCQHIHGNMFKIIMLTVEYGLDFLAKQHVNISLYKINMRKPWS